MDMDKKCPIVHADTWEHLLKEHLQCILEINGTFNLLVQEPMDTEGWTSSFHLCRFPASGDSNENSGRQLLN
ncbi:hypothetical protein AV530_015622 [Patagioenas fasciata monilis]|uniref:Uncharacterized protein n=1 Tax=Patagioenas fasciata monilis TaxID=372326 RepID=A0A1V4KIE1_PATFA|nr:hypothetical protein AV530_015622 [Patagioenas fasciata monilis]